MLTTIGTEYRKGMRNAFRNRRISNPSMGHEASPCDVAASRSSWNVTGKQRTRDEGASFETSDGQAPKKISRQAQTYVLFLIARLEPVVLLCHINPPTRQSYV